MTTALDRSVGAYARQGWQVMSMDGTRAVVTRSAPIGILRVLLILFTLPIGLIFIWAGRKRQTRVLTQTTGGMVMEEGGPSGSGHSFLRLAWKAHYWTVVIVFAVLIVAMLACGIYGMSIGG